MCGNVGIINLEADILSSTKLTKFFTQALHVDALRGIDGTGLAAIDMQGRIAIHKKGVASQEFLDDDRIKKVINDPLNQVLCGHNRWATTGALDDEGAHPFQHGKITMFHNGTLDTWTSLTQELFTIDSEAICASLNENGDIKTLESLDGAYALVWYNSEDGTLNFARNKERPLYFGLLEKSQSFMYASEKGMIEWLASRNDIRLLEMKELEIGQLLSIPITTNEKAKMTPFKIKPATYSYYNTNWVNYNSNYKTFGKQAIAKYPTYKYSHMDGHHIYANFTTYNNYPSSKSTNKFGYVSGIYTDCLGNDIQIRVGGRTKDEGLSLLNKKEILCRITSITSEDICYLRIVPSDEIKNIDMDTSSRLLDKAVRNALGKKELKGSSQASSSKYEDRIVGPNGVIITQKTFNKLTKHGCSNCSKDLLSSDQFDILWTNDNNPICISCSVNHYLV